ncbi:aldo/keto reductase [Lipingzhangella sp. LS1_29]|uniref:Aldo/keto reductase n=1 Tax=Lipingzhangella rawalii TaxID=2055835 RepID=A0ABU2H3B5_9ACTN|nr:aldo/keto reductase [Lipingzhangella rawalii]MDS1269119.1 aldo/keto reductase [Lipingzhangella rawalii]
MRNRELGTQGLTVAELGLGCMGMTYAYSGRDDAESRRTIERALEHGVTMFDTADIYGPWSNEELLGPILRPHRERIVLATKFGIEVGPDGRLTERVNGRPEYLRQALDGSLRRLGVDHIDLYYQHRVDPDVPIEETWGAMAELVTAGKVRYLGISEAAPETIRRAHAVHPVTALQSEYSLFTRDIETDGVLATLRELGIGLVAYSPLGRGVLSGTIRSGSDLPDDDRRRRMPRFQEENLDRNLAVVGRLCALAEAKGVTSAQLALAWVLAQGSDIVAIPGTKRRSYLEDNLAAAEITLSIDDLATIEQAAPVGVAAGARYDAGPMRRVRL